MTQIVHSFFNADLHAQARHLVALDNLEMAKAAVAVTGKAIEVDEPLQKCPGCNDCDCHGTLELRTIKDYASDFGVTFGGGALAQMTQAAMREAARQDKEVCQEKSGGYTFHPKVLEEVFAPLLKTIEHV